MALVLFLFVQKTNAQTFSIASNIADWAYLGTINLEGGMGVARRLSVSLGGKLNLWHFDDKKNNVVIQDQRETAYLGIKFWPWYVYSGWWVGAKGQYEKRISSNVWRPALENSTAIGGVLSTGYAIMLNKHLNIDFGVGAFGGRYIDYTLYRCSDCKEIRQQGPRNFIRFDDILITMTYIF